MRVTRRLVEAGLLLGIEVLDHVVIGDGRFVSFREKGLLWRTCWPGKLPVHVDGFTCRLPRNFGTCS
ncbi:MAG: JAB domain-containing protein [Desulfotomaculales bacterium]